MAFKPFELQCPSTVCPWSYYYYHPVTKEKTFLTREQTYLLQLLDINVCSDNNHLTSFFNDDYIRFHHYTTRHTELVKARNFVLSTLLAIPEGFIASHDLLHTLDNYSICLNFHPTEKQEKKLGLSTSPVNVQIYSELSFFYYGSCEGITSIYSKTLTPNISLEKALSDTLTWIESCKLDDPACYQSLLAKFQELLHYYDKIINPTPL